MSGQYCPTSTDVQTDRYREATGFETWTFRDLELSMTLLICYRDRYVYGMELRLEILS